MEFQVSKDRYVFKLVLCGDGYVGKTTLRRRYLGEGFETSYLETIGADFAIKNLKIDDKRVKFQIWDLAGQPKYAMVRPWYFKAALAGLIVFDITMPSSFQNLPKWIKELWEHNGTGKVPFVIIGNKNDLRGEVEEEVPKNIIETYVNKLNDNYLPVGFDIMYVETSAKTGENVDKAFETIGRQYFTYLEKQK
ncbi:MAG: Rab family GTPase [Candidatus Hodarchaeales archaeon]|jgi:small GTP-binding protein